MNIGINRQYKDRLFKLLFENNKEQQSTYNPNMPLRDFLYCGQLFEKYIEKQKLNIYGRTRLRLPTPQCYVFYNGLEEHEDREILRLSDLFECESEGGYEWIAIMLNINKGHNAKLLSQCLWLQRYSDFVDRIRVLSKEMTMKEAIDQAVEEFAKMGDEFGRILEIHRAEVKEMCLTEFNEQVYEASIREEGRIEERVKAALEYNVPQEQILTTLMEKFDLSREKAESYYRKYAAR